MKFTFLILLLFGYQSITAQEIFKAENLGFSMEKPSNWIVGEDRQVLDNLKDNIKLDQPTLDKLVAQSNDGIRIVTFFKYPIESTRGVIPTIKANLRKNAAGSFELFKKGIIANLNSMKQAFPDFKFLEQPYNSEIDGKKCVVASCSYTLKAKDGEEQVKFLIYAIYNGKNYFQVTFMDSQKDDNFDFFKKLAKTIKIE